MLSRLSHRCGNSDICREQGIDIFRAFDSFRSRFKRPRDHERDWKSDCDQHDHQTHNPVWDFQERKDLRRNLCDDPPDHGISDRHLVNIASLELSEKASRVHSGIPASKRSTSFWKRGSSRNGSRRLSILTLPNKPCSKISRSLKLCSSKRNASSLSPSARCTIAKG